MIIDWISCSVRLWYFLCNETHEIHFRHIVQKVRILSTFPIRIPLYTWASIHKKMWFNNIRITSNWIDIVSKNYLTPSVWLRNTIEYLHTVHKNNTREMNIIFFDFSTSWINAQCIPSLHIWSSFLMLLLAIAYVST